MTPIERAQIEHLKARWHEHADGLYQDEHMPGGWYLLDLMDATMEEPCSAYLPSGKRRRLDS